MSSEKRFQRRIENFTCDKCGHSVCGDGYTNHCPQCLWSKHVDVNPGDRASSCGGLMQPVGVEQKSGQFVIIHRCELCGFERRNKRQKLDSLEALIRIASSLP